MSLKSVFTGGKFDRNRLELGLAMIAALAAAWGIWYWMATVIDKQATIGVVAAAIDLSAPRRIEKEDIKVLHLPRAALPGNAVADPEGIIGHALTRSVSENEVITTTDLAYDRDPSSDSALIPNEAIGFVLPSSWLAAPMPKVRKNDFVTILAALRQNRGAAGVAGVLLRDARVHGATGAGSPEAVLLGITIDEAERLLQAHTSEYDLVVITASAQPNKSGTAPTSTPRGR